MKLATVCIEPGCPSLAVNGARCPAHEALPQQQIDRRRGKTSARGYGWQWQQQARDAIARQPWCSYCGCAGTADNPLTGDHVPAISKGGNAEQPPVVACRRCNSARGNR